MASPGAGDARGRSPSGDGPAGFEGISLAPVGWRPSPAFPRPNPLEAADLRLPLVAPAPSRPLTYLRAHYPLVPYPIALGGADDERPKPLSGAIVGGGRAPLPPSRPAPAETDPVSAERQGDVT